MCARKTLLVYVLIFGCCGSIWPTGTAEEPANHHDTIENARAILFSELTSRDPEVRREAIRMIRFEGSNRAFKAVLSLIQENEGYFFTSGSPLWQDDAVDTMFHLDPDATLEWLVSNNDDVLERFDLFRLFSAVGFDAIPLFDNVFWYIDFQSGPWSQLLYPLAFQEMYAATGNEIYESIVAFPAVISTENPEVYARQMAYRTQRGLTVDPIYHTLAQLGGIDPVAPIVSRSYTLSELLFQALMFRFGFTEEVYRIEHEIPLSPVVYSPQAEAKHGVSTDSLTFTRDLSDLAAFPIFVLNDAIAHLYAGVPKSGSAEIIFDGMAHLSTEEQARYASIVLDSPPTAVRLKLLKTLAQSSSAPIRRFVLERLVEEPPLMGLPVLQEFLYSETDGHCIAACVKLIGAYETESTLFLLTPLLTHDLAIVRCAAAGQILRIAEDGW
jgi:hypothetical protein